MAVDRNSSSSNRSRIDASTSSVLLELQSHSCIAHQRWFHLPTLTTNSALHANRDDRPSQDHVLWLQHLRKWYAEFRKREQTLIKMKSIVNKRIMNKCRPPIESSSIELNCHFDQSKNGKTTKSTPSNINQKGGVFRYIIQAKIEWLGASTRG